MGFRQRRTMRQKLATTTEGRFSRQLVSVDVVNLALGGA